MKLNLYTNNDSDPFKVGWEACINLKWRFGGISNAVISHIKLSKKIDDIFQVRIMSIFNIRNRWS